MKRKKRILAIISIVIFFLVISIIFISTGNGQDESLQNTPKTPELSNLSKNIDDSISEIQENNDKLGEIKTEFEYYQNSLPYLLDSYERLGKEINQNLNNIKNISEKLDNADKNYGKLTTKLDNIKQQIIKQEVEIIINNQKKSDNLLFFNVILLTLNFSFIIFLFVSHLKKDKLK